jgi:hypothetical protein
MRPSKANMAARYRAGMLRRQLGKASGDPSDPRQLDLPASCLTGNRYQNFAFAEIVVASTFGHAQAGSGVFCESSDVVLRVSETRPPAPFDRLMSE